MGTGVDMVIYTDNHFFENAINYTMERYKALQD